MVSHPLRRATDRAPDRAAAAAPAPAPSRPSVSLVVPVRGDARGADWLLEQVPGCVEEIVLVGDARALARVRVPAPVAGAVRRIEQPGARKGDVPHAGMLAACGERVVLIASNGSMSPKEIPHYLHYLDSGYDFVKGSRFIAGGCSAGYPLVRRAGHVLLLFVARRLYGQRLTDLWYGFCAFRREFVPVLDLRPDGVELGAEMVVHALHYGLRVTEVPGMERARPPEALRAATFRDGTRILRTMLRERPRTALPRLLRLLTPGARRPPGRGTAPGGGAAPPRGDRA
ncbi:glycosyltransferase family 2 protein [Streptomyces zhihengii]|uniref:glycosyltransferase family 2 protein n=2 Tax=Streptomyces zhihengii TaxID=1818004 RepID=UPI0036253E49